ncbi:MAG: PAS domain S-box protein [Rhodoferax sp.]|uniref:PAS domain S-box protein n=1 Tax=Rhodoferax sp. TaxID=50421 RepID=UPI001B5415A8|nr:PAS domain S-box protein [Rhodoferax sp.]MBP9905281.1 PAS domain S-box protein [Rhodoferax sp.]
MPLHIVQNLNLQGLARYVDVTHIHPQDAAALQDFLDHAGAEGAQSVVFRVMDALGTWQWFELQSQPLENPADPESVQLIGVLADITERERLAEHATLQRKFLEVLAQSPDRPTLIATMLDTVLGLSDLDGGGLYWERGDGGFDLLISRGLSQAFLINTGNIEPDDPRAGMIQAGAMVCSCIEPQDVCTDPGLVRLPQIQAEGIVALVVLPIRVAGRGHACLNLASKHVRQLPPASITLLQSLAEQFGLAIERLVAREDALNQRQNLDGFFNALQDFVFVLNPQGEMLYVNPAVHLKLGYDKSLLGQSVLAVHPERVHASAWSIVTEMLQGKRESCPLPLLKADGSEIMVDTRIVHGHWNGQPALLGVSRDISERRSLEQALEKQHDTLRTLINTIPELVWLKDVKGVYLACNPAFEAFFGQIEANIVGKTDFDFVDEELAQFFRTNDLAAIEAGGLTYNEEWITYAIDGRRALLSTCKTPMYGSDGSLQGVLGISHDITEQRRTEEALVMHQHHLQQLVDERTSALNASHQKLLSTQFAMECVGIGIHWVDFETGRFIAVNQKAAQMIGYEVAEMLQLTVMDVDPNFPRSEYDRIKEIIRNQGQISIETQQRCRDGKYLPLEVSIYYHEGGEAMSPHLISFQTDITQRKAAEQALIDAKQQAEAATVAKSAFLANMSHEIRTPLNAITGMTHLIRRSGVTAEQSERLGKIEMAGSHLLEIINTILDLSKIEAGKFTLEEVALDVGAIVANVASILSHQVQAKKLSFVIDNQLSSCNFVGDPTRLQQGLLNFGSNAIKFSDRGTVTLRVQLLESTADASLLRFEVEDQGIGVAPAVLPRLFTAFEQADNSTTRQYGGTGLGLAITKKLAQLMDGDAGASSTLGQGSVFWFTARLRRGAACALSQKPVPTLPAETILARDYADRRLLLVEDDPFNQEITLIMLQEIWPVVDLAEDGLQAVECVRNKRYDLILMDMQMPRMDGLDATRQLRTLPNGVEVPVIAMTGNAFVEDRNRCFGAGMNDFLSKPVHPNDLFEVILKWVRR